jgi:hypothetical protein
LVRIERFGILAWPNQKNANGNTEAPQTREQVLPMQIEDSMIGNDDMIGSSPLTQKSGNGARIFNYTFPHEEAYLSRAARFNAT